MLMHQSGWLQLPKILALDDTIEGFCRLGRHCLIKGAAVVVNLQVSKSGLVYAAGLVQQVCWVAGDPDLITDARAGCEAYGLPSAVQAHDNGPIFDWLIQTLSYQGIADRVATSYLNKHGSITIADIDAALNAKPACSKLISYWHFHGCGYRKAQASCREPYQFADCPVPKADLRNGNLNQAAYSLYLFMRDVAGGDFVSWLDTRLANADYPTAADRVRRLCHSLLEPLVHVYGASNKVWSMALAGLLLGADPARERWVAAGTGMIAIDRLVHNWLHRTGILDRCDAAHAYGPACYGQTGCAVMIDQLAAQIDARAFNSDFPKVFPRYVQSAIWAFCAQQRLDLCNGNHIDDRTRCDQSSCPLYDHCDRVTLHPPKAEALAT